MNSAVTLTLSQTVLVVAGMAVFGLIGFRLGINRGLVIVIGVVLAMFLASQFAPGLVPKVNRYYKLGKLAISGGLGADDLAKAWDAAKSEPDIIQDDEDETLFELGLFALVLLIAWIVAHLMHRNDPSTVMLRLLGAGAGIVNGFLITYYLMPIIFPNPETLISLPSGEVNKTLASGQTISRVVAVFVLVLIMFGLYRSSRGNQRGGAPQGGPR